MINRNRKPRLLVIDSSFAVAPIYDAAKRNFQVTTMGNIASSKYFSLDPNQHYIGDYGDIDSVRKFVNQQNFEFIVPGCTDVSLGTFAALKREYSEIISRVSTKAAFSEFCRTVGINSPREFTPTEKLSFPIIIKPSDSYSGRGVNVLESEDDLQEAIEFAKFHSSSGNYIMQEFIDGQLYSVSCFRDHNANFIQFLVEEHCNQHSYSVDQSFVVEADPAWSGELDSLVDKVFAAIPSHVRFFHLQFIVSKNKITCLEMFLRCPGDLYGQLISMASGVDYGRLYLDAYDGSIDLSNVVQKPLKNIRRLTLKTEVGGIVTHPKKLPSACLYYEATLETGYRNNSLLPVRKAVVFEAIDTLSNDCNIYETYGASE